MIAFLRFGACRPLSSTGTTGAAFLPASPKWRGRSHLYHSATNGVDERKHPVVDSPYFPIYYNDIFEVDLPPGHRFPMTKYRMVRKSLERKVRGLPEEERLRVHCEFCPSPLATIAQLATTHDANYIHRYLNGNMTQAENRNIGFPWSLQHVNRTLSSVGGTVAAACAAWEEYARRIDYLEESNGHQTAQFVNQRTAHLCWAGKHHGLPLPICSFDSSLISVLSAHVAGGTHHAFKDYGEGFCIFSDIAVAANVLLQRYSLKRILIIDLDVHQGNGNAALFRGNAKVQTFSMHCSANYFSEKEKSDLDVELPVGCDDETYLSTLRYWLRRIEQHNFEAGKSGASAGKQFDLIFFQSGVDIHQKDRLGRLSITPNGISRRNFAVYDFAHRMQSPLVICMGGGYPKSDDWASIIEAHAGVYWDAHQFLSKQLNVDDSINYKLSLVHTQQL
ncbi:hypothetical protein ACHAWF_005210 [Thalassiosira exigua]